MKTHSTTKSQVQPSGLTSGKIAVLDDLFPHPGSAFRFEEFRSYLDDMAEVSVYTTGEGFAFAKDTRSVDTAIADHNRQFPHHEGRIAQFDYSSLPEADLYYSAFVGFIDRALGGIEHSQKPFVFTLYPGGGFLLNDERSDAMLRRVFGSPCFEKVIVTQSLTRAYLLEQRFCQAEQIVDLHGGVLTRAAIPAPIDKQYYGRDKSTLDIAFVANRYTRDGADKGYDLFVGAAARLLATSIDIRLHVVGDFDANTISLEGCEDRFTFYGPQLTPFFNSFYRKIDMIVSPTRPFVLRPGKFDGFPTGCAVEAGLREVAVLCTDQLGLNLSYIDGEDLIIVRPEVDDIVSVILKLADDPSRLPPLGRNMRKRALQLYGREQQILPRISLLREVLKNQMLKGTEC